MKKLAKPFTSIFLTIVMIITLLPISASAVSYSVNYWEHTEPTRTLSYSGGSMMYGDDVKWFQCAINSLVIHGDCSNSYLNTTKLDVDGYFGNASKTALLEFQKKYGLEKDGKLGPVSRERMKSLLRPAPTSSSSSSSSSSEPYYSPVSKNVTDGVYYIRNKMSNKYLSVSGGATCDRADIVQYSFHGDPCQQFRIRYESNGFYKIYPMNAESKCFDLHTVSAANSNGTDLMMFSGSLSYMEQNFRFRKMNDGSVEIGSVASYGEKVLEVTNSSYSDDAIIQVWNRSDSRDNDNWFLEPINDYTTKAPNQFNIPSNRFPLGSVNYGGYRYKIVTQDDIPDNGMTKVTTIIKKKKSFSIATAIVNYEIEGEDYHAPGILGLSTYFSLLNAVTSAVDYVDVTLTLYKSKSSNMRYATVEAYDSALQRRLYDEAGGEFFGKNSEGRTEKMQLDKGHRPAQSQYNGFINSNGEFCLAFKTFDDDFVAVRDTEALVYSPTWTKYPRFKYGKDNAHETVFAPIIANDEFVNLLNQCIR